MTGANTFSLTEPKLDILRLMYISVFTADFQLQRELMPTISVKTA